MWWAYFDVESAAMERALTGASAAARARLAQDVHSYLHIPLVLGIVLVALGLKTAIGHLGESLGLLVAVALSLGVALFFAGLAAIRLRRRESPGAAWLAAAVVAIVVLVVATRDLVYVFAFTQVTAGMAGDTTWSGLGGGAILFVVLWWAWGAAIRLRLRRSPGVTGPAVVAVALAFLVVATRASDGGHRP